MIANIPRVKAAKKALRTKTTETHLKLEKATTLGGGLGLVYATKED